MSGLLTAASNEWATRPADQRFATLGQMYLKTLDAAEASSSTNISPKALHVNALGGDVLQLETPSGPMALSNYAFGQLANRIEAPASYLRELGRKGRTDLVAMNLNAGLNTAEDGDEVQMYHQRIGNTNKLLALTSTKYGRIYNHEVVQALMEMQQTILKGWRTPPAMPSSTAPGQPTRLATAADVGQWTNVALGQTIVDSGLYASDKDMFAFLIDPEHRIDDGTDGGLSRGFWVTNSEVGDATFSIVKFMFRFVCQNNNVWGSKQVQTISVKHLGRGARGRAFDKLAKELKIYAESSAAEDEERIKAAKALVIGNNLEDVQDVIFSQKRLCSKRQVADAYDLASQFEDVDGNPNTCWGLGNGITRLSQRTLYADERTALDVAAGAIFSLAA